MKNEKGYALLLTMGILICFTVLGFSLLTLSSSGLKKSETRQSIVQAQDLSKKSLDYSVERLKHELEQEIGVDGLNANDFQNKFVAVLNESMCIDPSPINVADETDRFKIMTPTGLEQFSDEKMAEINNTTIEQMKRTGQDLTKKLTNESTGFAQYCVVSYQDSEEDGVKNPFVKDVLILTKGKTNSSDSYLASTVSIGSNSVPDELNYALGSSVPSNNSNNGDGNIIMIGKVDIEGNIYAAGNLFTARHSYYNMNKLVGFPVIHNKNKDGNEIASKVVFGKKVYVLESNGDFDYKNIECYSDKLSKSGCGDLNGDNFKEITNPTTKPNSFFNTTSKVSFVDATPVRESIDIDGSIIASQKETQLNSLINLSPDESEKTYSFEESFYKVPITGAGKTINDNGFANHSKIKIKPQYLTPTNECIGRDKYNKCNKWKMKTVSYKNTRLLSGNYIGNSLYFDSSVSITGKQTEVSRDSSSLKVGPTKLAAYKNSEGNGGIIYIDGDLCIGSEHIHSIDDKFGGTTCSNDIKRAISGGPSAIDVELEGAFYVTGSVVMADVNLTANALIYAEGGFETKDTKINGKILGNGKKGNLLVFAKDEIHFSGTSGVLNGFYYSESAFVGWGDKNGLLIDGGVSGRKIYLYTTDGQYAGPITTKDGNNLITSPLKIKYNPDIVKTYSDLKHQEQKIYTVDTVNLQNREIQ